VAARPSSGVPAPAPHELRRERLLEVLHRHSTRPLLLLVAPGGFGKSTLAATYARDSGAVVVWLTLQAADRDSRRLFNRLADAFEAAFEAADPAASPELRRLPELRQGLESGAEGTGLARLLLADVAQAPAGFILVLDDFHLVQDAEDVMQAVDALVRGLPEMGQLVVTAREAPALSMTRLVARGAVFALGAEDLRFTSEETRALRQALGGDASHDDEAEGWVTGILLGGAPHQLGIGGGELLGAYVERELLVRMPPREQRWLETLAVLETITPTAAERLLGAGAWPVRLHALAQSCPFLVAGQDGSYRLHSLVRDSLLNRLRRSGARRAARVWGVARELAEEAFDTVGVVRACQELGQTEGVITLIRRSVDEAVLSGRWSAVLAALDLLPENVRRAHPDLSLAEAHALVSTGRVELARQAAEDALHHGGRSGHVGTQVNAIAWLARIAQFGGELNAAEDWLSAADHLLNHAELPLDQRRLLEGRVLNVRGICSTMRGRFDDAVAAFGRAEQLLRLLHPSRELALVEHNYGSFCCRTGDYVTAQTMLSEAAAHWRLFGDRGMLATTQMQLGDVYLRCGNLAAAGSAFTGAAEVARAAGAPRNEGWAVLSLAEWHRASGRIADAVATIDEVLGLASEIGERELVLLGLLGRAELAILQNDLRTARELLPRAQAEAQRLGSDAELALVDLALGRLHLAEGAGERAVSHCDAALQRGSAVWGAQEQVVAHYWLGTAYLALGRAERATEILEQALRLSEAAPGVAPLVAPVAEDPSLLKHGLRVGLEPSVLAEIERQAATRRPWSGVPERAPIAVVARNDLPRLEARLFGNFILHRDGELVEPEARKVDRARELFALLLLHPNGLPDREIAELLWPEMAPQRGLHNLQMTAYLLRRWLGAKAALRYSAGTYQLNPQMEVWADVRAFEASLARAHGARDEALAHSLERAVELYRGALLADVAWLWVDPLRMAYRSRFATAALQLADLISTLDPARSDGLAERVIEIEPENDSAYERLFLNARARGDLLAAARVARRYGEAAVRLGLSTNPVLLQAAR
jgi:LuxR family transcriptional regulator, maltose regulon positive regulatory protein